MIIGELIVAGVGVITTGLSALISHRITKRKYKVEVDNEVIRGMQESLKFYEDLSQHNHEKLQEILEENKKIVEENRNLRQEVEELKQQLLELSTNLYLDLSYQNRVKTRARQLENKKNNVKTKDRLDKKEGPSGRGRKSVDEERDPGAGE